MACPLNYTTWEHKIFFPPQFHFKKKEKKKKKVKSHPRLHAPLWSKSYWTGPKLRCMEEERNPTFSKVEQIFRTRA